MDAVLLFGACLVTLRLAASLAARYRERRAPEYLAWCGSLAAYAIASGALAWGAAAGWGDPGFRIYYLCGALLTAPLLGAGSLLRVGVRPAGVVALVWTGLAVGVMLAEPLTAAVAGHAIPTAQDHLDFLPVRLLAIVGNAVGTLAAVVVALSSFRRRPLGSALLLAGIAVAALGSALAGLGVMGTAGAIAAAALLLYGGFVAPSPSPITAARGATSLPR